MIVQKKTVKIRIGLIGGTDIIQQRRPDDATSAPDTGYRFQLETVFVFPGRFGQQRHALGIGNNEGRIQDVLQSGDECCPVVLIKPWFRSRQHQPGFLPLIFISRQVTHHYGSIDIDGRYLEGQGVPGGPFAGAFLAGDIQDHVDQRLVALIVDPAEDFGSDFHQKTAEFAAVPLFINRLQFRVGHTQPAFHQIVGFGDQLHQPVFDAVMHHLDIMAGRTGPQISHAGFIVDEGGAVLQNFRDPLISRHGTAGHKAGAFAGAGGAAGHAHAQVKISFFFQSAQATVCV